jgi:hypothetical protein
VPVVLEAVVVDGESTIDFGSLEPGGATLVVAYDGIKTGDRVQTWGLTPPNNYDETQVGFNASTFDFASFERRGFIG